MELGCPRRSLEHSRPRVVPRRKRGSRTSAPPVLCAVTRAARSTRRTLGGPGGAKGAGRDLTKGPWSPAHVPTTPHRPCRRTRPGLSRELSRSPTVRYTPVDVALSGHAVPSAMSSKRQQHLLEDASARRRRKDAGRSRVPRRREGTSDLRQERAFAVGAGAVRGRHERASGAHQHHDAPPPPRRQPQRVSRLSMAW